MKIIQNNKEYGYQQPIVNNIDVLLDVTNRTSGIADGTTLALNNTISGYERLIISIWTANSTAGIKWAKYVKTNEVAVSDILADASFTVPMITVWDLSNGNYGNVEFDSSTYKSVTVHKGSNVGIGRIKIEGVKKAAQIANLTSKRLTVTVPNYITESYITGELLGDWAHIHGGFRSNTTYINVGSTVCNVNGIKFDSSVASTVGWCTTNDTSITNRFAFVEAANGSNVIKMRDIRAEANCFYWFDIICKCVPTE